MAQLYILLFLFVVLPSELDGVCRNDWIKYTMNNTWYKIFSEKKSWNEAKTACVQQQAKLAEPKDFNTNDFIRTNIVSKAWIGAHRCVGGVTCFVNNNYVSYTPFAYYEPDMKSDQQNANETKTNLKENDFAILIQADGRWADELKRNRYPYICEMTDPYPEPHMLVSALNEIYAVDLKTLVTSAVIRGLKNNYAMAVDAVERKLYYKDGDKLSRSNIDGSGGEVLLKGVKVWKMTVDWISPRLFWIDHSNRKIEVLNLKDQKKERRIVVFTAELKMDIAVDPAVGYVFWTQKFKLQRINLVTKKTVTVAKKHRYHFAITLDHDNKTVYWIDRTTDSIIILSSDYDGRGKKIIESGISKYYMLSIYLVIYFTLSKMVTLMK